jgi:hypothetical protein
MPTKVKILSENVKIDKGIFNAVYNYLNVFYIKFVSWN